MKRIALFLVFASIVGAASSAAVADSLIGTYNGTVFLSRGLQLGLRIEVLQHDGASLKGKAVFYQNFCGGTFPFEGEVNGGTMKLLVAGSNGCDPRTYELQVQGKKLVGTLRRGPDVWDIELK